MSTTLTELLERVKGAEGPDRHIDARLHLMVHPELGDHPWRQPDLGWWVHEEGGHSDEEADCYTGSIDAALALVERKLGTATMWSVCIMEEGPFAQLLGPMPDGGYVGGLSVAHGRTPALAILAALLRALIHQDHPNG